MKTVIGYCRVSTEGQGRSGLGMEAQYEDIRAHATRCGYDLLEVVTEVASGGLDETQRPVLAAALAESARKDGPTILVSKLCRLSRDSYLIKRLTRELKATFEVVECPNVSGLELGLRAEFVEEERRKISERTKSALAAKRARGDDMDYGTPTLVKHRAKGSQTMKDRAAAEIEPYRLAFSELVGLPVRDIAQKLNERMVKTPRGGRWHRSQVHRALQRLELA